MYVEDLQLTGVNTPKGTLSEVTLMELFATAQANYLMEGRSTADLVDREGRSLYPGFYWTHLAVPRPNLISGWKQGANIQVAVETKHFAGLILDGRFAIGTQDMPLDDPDDWEMIEVPRMRAGTIFLPKTDAPIFQPYAPVSRLAHLPKLRTAPKTMQRFTEVQQMGNPYGDLSQSMWQAAPIDYQVVIGRDVAHSTASVSCTTMVKIMDAAEREILNEQLLLFSAGQSISQTETLEREVFFVSTCQANDVITIHTYLNIGPCVDTKVGSQSDVESVAEIAFVMELRCQDRLVTVARGRKVLCAQSSVAADVRHVIQNLSKTDFICTNAGPTNTTVQQAPTKNEIQPEKIFAIAATFTAEPMDEMLQFWFNKLELGYDLKFAPYAQVFQQLLDPTSAILNNGGGISAILIRLEDWRGHEDGSIAKTHIRRNADDFVQALKGASNISTATFLVIYCRPSPRLSADPEYINLFYELEERAKHELEELSSVHVVCHSDVDALYSVPQYWDPHGEELARVPYTKEYFAALSTLLVRRTTALRRKPYKVIVLDCDETLWSGVCGEDGPRGVKVDAPRQGLQKFMLEQRNAGRLLCLCSKNIESDVWAVFDECSDMLIRRDDIVSFRINWQPKPENVCSLADELDLGLDSFIFVDDNPVECAAMQEACPEVLTVRLPDSPAMIVPFLRNFWPFDKLKVTAEDQKRTRMYQENRLRKKAEEAAPSLMEFLDSLQLAVEILPVSKAQLERVAQLTQRTNQFNATAVRRDVSGLAKALQEDGLECLTVRVSDRFGDYGLVGVMIFADDGLSIKVDTFLLSCRTLGRGVEHQMLRRLGEIARERDVELIRVPYVQSARNSPLRNFLIGVAKLAPSTVGDAYEFRFLPAQAEQVHVSASSANDARKSKPKKVSSRSRENFIGIRKSVSQTLSEIATDLSDPQSVLTQVICDKEPRSTRLHQSYVAPRTKLERQILEIWQQALRIDQIGVCDDFFALGGSSLQAVHVISYLHDHFGFPLTLELLNTHSTIAELANRISAKKN